MRKSQQETRPAAAAQEDPAAGSSSCSEPKPASSAPGASRGRSPTARSPLPPAALPASRGWGEASRGGQAGPSAHELRGLCREHGQTRTDELLSHCSSLLTRCLVKLRLLNATSGPSSQLYHVTGRKLGTK